MSHKNSKDLSNHRLEQAKENLAASKLLTEKFSKKMGRRIADASKIREDSDYDDEFIVSEDDTQAQIQTAEELINLVEATRENRF